jgi:hypothetical protein
MNSPLQNRKVRLRGLGGPAERGVPCTGASATEKAPEQAAIGINPRVQSAKADFVMFQPRFQPPGESPR